MNKLLALFSLFRQGVAVADPALWKGRQLTATLILPLVGAAVSAARVYGVNVPLNDAEVAQLTGAAVAAVNLVLTVTTSKTVGV